MQDLYMVTLPLALNQGHQDLDAAAAAADDALQSWLRDRVGIENPQVPESTSPDGTARSRRRVLQVENRSLIRYDVQHPDRRQTRWGWRVGAWVGRDHTMTWMRCRLGVVALTGQVVEPELPAGRPGFVAQLLREHDVQTDGRRLGTPSLVTSGDVGALVELLTDPDRRLPVVVIAPAAHGRPAVDPARLSDKLGGLAHVVHLAARTTTFLLSDVLGVERSTFNGAVRLYWPGFSRRSAPRRHPVWLGDRVEALGFTDLSQQLFQRIGSVSSLSLAVPDLERELRREQAVATQQLVRQRLAEAARQRSTSVVDDPAWRQEYERAAAAEQELGHQLEDSQFRVLELEEELEAVRQAFAQVAKADAATGDVTEAADNTEVLPPQTVVEAVTRAQAACQYLVILPEALRSASASQYKKPVQVLEDLLALDRLAGDWQRGVLTSDFKTAFHEAGLTGYRGGVSDTARQKYEADYRRRYGDQTILLGPHLRRGVGAVSEILRIYWHADDDERVFVVGHVGEKLRDDSNP